MDKVYGHQWPLSVVVPFGHADLTTALAEAATQLPPNAIVCAGDVTVETAFDYATSGVIDVGDADDDDRYSATPIDLTSAGRTALTITGHKYTAPTDILVTPTLVGAVSAGAGRLTMYYSVEGRQNEVTR